MKTKYSTALSISITLFVTISIIAFVIKNESNSHAVSATAEKTNKEAIPNDWFFRQRAYPGGKIDVASYRKALAYKKEKTADQRRQVQSRLDTAKWVFAGPTNIGGRVTDIEITHEAPIAIYVGTAAGGVFLSEDEGLSWTPLFDHELSLAIGDLAIALSDNQILYVGTGEPNGGGGSITYDGNGIYKSIDGGLTWTNIGLNDIGSVGKVLVSPLDPDVCYVAAMGPLFKKDSHRGVYKTSDGGLSWNKILFINDSTGIIDMVINPQNPEIIYAAAWQRVRTVDRNSYGGPSSGIYKSSDSGVSWTKLGNGLPASAGRIGLALSESNPSILYSFIVDEVSGRTKGIYTTADGGGFWQALSLQGIWDTSYMWWFGKIEVDKDDPNIIYVPGFQMHKSINGGESWLTIFNGAHVDQHALARHPQNANMLFAGNDGGIYISQNGGGSHVKSPGLPITQFYTCEIDYTIPERLYGGAQDNGTVRTLTGALSDWQTINGGDGFKVLVDPNDNNYIYSEYQYGALSRSTNGGTSFVNALAGIGSMDRKNWNTPVVFNPTNTNELYYGTNRLYRSVNKAVSWSVISPDLTTGPIQNNLVYGTITSISVSPVDEDIIMIGTDDGVVQVTSNGGSDWTKISDSLPDRWVTSVAVDQEDVETAFVTFSGYRYGTNMGHIYKTTNLGEDWVDISGDLPDIPINDFIQTSTFGFLYIATDIGVFYSTNDGQNWKLLGLSLPNLVITDICYHEPENFLLAASYGRGMYKIALDEEVISSVDENTATGINMTAYPNPSTENVTLTFTSPKRQFYKIEIHTISGEHMKSVYDDYLNDGQQNFNIDVSLFPPGVYICSLTAGNYIRSIRIVKN